MILKSQQNKAERDQENNNNNKNEGAVRAWVTDWEVPTYLHSSFQNKTQKQNQPNKRNPRLGKEVIFEEKMAENILELKKDMNPQIEKTL